MTSPKSNIIDLNKGKLPPQAVDLEEAVLGAMMVDKKGLFEAIDKLSVESFYKDQHKHIFEAIKTLFFENENVDLLTVSSQLKKTSKLELSGGDLYLIQLTQKISSSAHIEYHSRILAQKHIQRKCIAVSNEILSNAYNDDFDVFDLLDNVYKNFDSVNELINVGKEENFEECVLDFISEKNVSSEGIKSSINDFNRSISGYQNTDLVILAARPGMGKTAFVLNELLAMAINGEPVAFFSLEMSIKQIIGRLLSIISGIPSNLLRNVSNLSQSEKKYLNECALFLAKLPIFIDDTSGISPLELKLKLMRLKREKGIKICFVDYLQLMRVKEKKISREQEVSIISGSLKGIAKELDLPMIALSQLSRKVEERGSSKRPLLSDLRDSGSIEQDADMVVFLYRPEYYKIDEWDDEERSPTTNTAELDIAKFRNGETGYVRIGCNLKYMRFYDIELQGTDIGSKYFQTENKPKFEEMKELPKPTPNEAFGNNNFENDDIPF